MQQIALIDYGSGNLRSAEKALQRAAAAAPRRASVAATSDPEVVAGADLVVLPGVGAFAACMAALAARPGVIEAMTEAVRRRGVPFLGICVGLQLMAERGLEFGETPGLGWIDGDAKPIAPAGPKFKVPHMGWNELDGALPPALFAGLPPSPHMYFTHSFAIFPADPADIAATADHGGPIVAAVLKGNLAGVQFHPEKSQGAGAQLIANVLEWRP
jgi:glutamine amidotransferase